MSCQPDAGDPRASITDFEVVDRYRHCIRWSAPIRAPARNHQIRLHFAAIGHPVVGDEFYGPFGQIKLTKAEYEALRQRATMGRSVPNGEEEPTDADTGGNRHALHAHRLEFEHPILGGRVTFESALPGDRSTR